jgi:hypothetical protein
VTFRLQQSIHGYDERALQLPVLLHDRPAGDAFQLPNHGGVLQQPRQDVREAFQVDAQSYIRDSRTSKFSSKVIQEQKCLCSSN